MVKTYADHTPKRPKKAAKPLPKQKVLPGMQDRRIAALENAALKYADVRDERMHWTKREVEAKKKVKDLMHEQKRTHYSRGNIEIELVPEDEHVHVRVHDREQSPVIDGQYPEVDEPPVKEPESPEDQPVEEPENPDEYDSRKPDEPSEF